MPLHPWVPTSVQRSGLGALPTVSDSKSSHRADPAQPWATAPSPGSASPPPPPSEEPVTALELELETTDEPDELDGVDDEAAPFEAVDDEPLPPGVPPAPVPPSDPLPVPPPDPLPPAGGLEVEDEHAWRMRTGSVVARKRYVFKSARATVGTRVDPGERSL
jgi:hypothetical protein